FHRPRNGDAAAHPRRGPAQHAGHERTQAQEVANVPDYRYLSQAGPLTKEMKLQSVGVDQVRLNGPQGLPELAQVIPRRLAHGRTTPCQCQSDFEAILALPTPVSNLEHLPRHGQESHPPAGFFDLANKRPLRADDEVKVQRWIGATNGDHEVKQASLGAAED